MADERYSVDGVQTVTTSPADTALGITGGTTIRPAIYEIQLSCTGAAEDSQIQWTVGRSTAAGTSTSVTPQPLSGGPTATTAAGENHTVEPTYTAGAILWNMALNSRASHRWVAADVLGRLQVPATASNGAGIYPDHASATPAVLATFHFAE